MPSFVHSLFEHHLALLLESILLSHHVKVRSATVQQEREARDALAVPIYADQKQVINIPFWAYPGFVQAPDFHFDQARGHRNVDDRSTLRIKSRPNEGALMSPSTAPLCGRANGHRGVSTRRCVHVLKPRDRPSQRPPSILLFLFLSWGPVHYNPFLAQFLRSLCKLVPGAHTTHPPRERERGH